MSDYDYESDYNEMEDVPFVQWSWILETVVRFIKH